MRIVTGIALAFIGLNCFLMVRLVLTGQASRSLGRSAQAESHHAYAKMLAISTALLVVAIEIGTRLKGGARHDGVFWVHAVFAFGYVATLALLFRYTGHRSAYHAWIAYANIAFFVGLVLVGLPMMIERF